jgi:hypothetical protein
VKFLKGDFEVHFIILKSLWRQFKDILPDLGYSITSEFLRDAARVAVGGAPERREGYWRAIVVNGGNDAKGLICRLERGASQGGQNAAAGSPKSRTVQVHFNLPEKLWQLLLAKLPDLGYSTASEFFRARVREAIARWSSQA